MPTTKDKQKDYSEVVGHRIVKGSGVGASRSDFGQMSLHEE
jgi:hypothetical protein